MSQSNARKANAVGKIHITPLRPARTFHVKRVECRVTSLDGQSSSTSIRARLLLNDLHQEGLAVYSPEILPSGILVSLELEYPDKLSLRAKVGWCQQLTGTTRVITPSSQSYRIGLLFELGTSEERARIKAFCDRLEELYPGIDLTRAPYAA